MRDLPEELLRGPFSVARARQLGVEGHLLRSRRFRTPVRGVRVPARLPPSLALDCAAHALVLPPDAAFSHATAARLYGLAVPQERDDGRLHVSVSPDVAVPRLPSLTGHQTTADPHDVRTLSGLWVTTPERTLCDLATAGWHLLDLLVIADGALARGRWTVPERVAERVERWQNRRGVLALRHVLALMETCVDSPMETRLRYLLLRAGLPRPVVNVPVTRQDGSHLHTPDLSWPRWRVAVDYDGAHHFVAGGEQGDWRRRQDAARQELLQEEGWTLRIMTAADVLRRPHQAVERTTRALLAAGARW